MRIDVRQAGGISDVSVFLTEREAAEVAKALRFRLDGDVGYQGPGYHLHLEDGEGSELTIGVLDPE
jgi:hypothetical protein